MNAEPNRAELRWTQIQAALAHVERWLAPEVERVARTYESSPTAGLHGLLIGPDEARRSIAGKDRETEDRRLAEAVQDLPEWPRLAEHFGLDEFDGGVLLLTLAPEIETRFGRLYSFIQDDLARFHPGFELILTLLTKGPADRIELRRRLSPDAPLLRHRLVEPRREPGGLWLTTRLSIEPQILRLIIGDPGLDERVAECARLAHPLTVTEDVDESALGMADKLLSGGRPAAIWLDGPDATAKRRVALAAASRTGLRLIEIDELTIPSDRPPHATAAILVREAILKGAVLFLDGLEDNGSREPCSFCAALLAEIRRQDARAFLAGEQTWLRASWAARGLSRIPVPRPSPAQREELWQRSLATHGLDFSAEQTRILARRYRLTGQQIDTAVSVAAAPAPIGPENGYSISDETSFTRVVAATRAQTGQKIGELASRRPPAACWADLILPEDSLQQLREFCRRVELRETVLWNWGFERRAALARGVHALFAGASGTGKTMAAEIIADELGLDLFRISVPNVVSKFIGETEKNLDRIFNAAEDSNAILFFDEADSIIGKRSEVRDSHDRYANLEISFLLQKMEEFDGVSILATNLRANIDDAFTRRLSFVIHFPFPDAKHRRLIWEGAWPDSSRRPRDLDFDRVAEAFKLSGASITNIALAASFLAAEEHDRVGLGHVVTAIRREYQKLGRPMDEAELRTSLLSESLMADAG